MTTLCIDDLSTAARQRLDQRPTGYRSLGADQCRLTMLRFAPDCSLQAVMTTLRQGGYSVDQPDQNGVCWVRQA